MKLNVCDITRGSGTWIMNLHTIRSDYFRQVFTNWWVYWKLEKKSFSNLREWWDIAKIKIKSITIEASKKVNTTDDKIKALENKLETLKDISEPSRQQLEELADLENQIHSHYENKTDAARLRAKVDWYEKGEQSTKYFFNLERKNGQNKLWQKIRGLDGNLKYDIDEILDEQINFYANLFSTEGWDKNVAEELVTHMDLVINEYIKSTTNTFIDIYEQLFNIIFETGIVPDNWLMGNIKPIYKNKGDKMDPKNYRPITILSCLGKLFTAVLSERLTKYSDDFFILNENQCGFRKGYSTLDNLFVLFNFFEILKNKKNKMFCAFIDFEKAFDKVWRDGLWYKLLLNNMNGNMYNIIVNMYSGTKSCISYNDCKSEFFPCNNGVRQGENLYPFFLSCS